MFCRHCGNEMAAEAAVCVKCGVPAGKGKRFCPNCGFEHAPEAVICVNCGASLNKTSTPSDDDVMESLACFRETLDNLPFIATLLLVIFADGIYGGLYRLTKGDVTGIVMGILWIVTGGLFGIGTIIDIIGVAVNKKITFLA